MQDVLVYVLNDPKKKTPEQAFSQ